MALRTFRKTCHYLSLSHACTVPENLSLPVTGPIFSDRFTTKPVTAFSADFPHDQDQIVTGSDRFPPLLLLRANPLHVRAGKGLRKPVTTCHCAEVAE